MHLAPLKSTSTHDTSSPTSDIVMESDSEPDITQDVTPPQVSVKLPSGQSLTASQIFDAITNESHSIVDSIPNGFKDNFFFCLTIVKTFTVAKIHNTVHLPTIVGHGTHTVEEQQMNSSL